MKAILTIQPAHLTGQINLRDYDILIVNPSMDPGLVAQAKAGGYIKQDASIYGTFNTHMIWMGASPYFTSLRQVMDEFLIRDESGEVVRSSSYPNYGYIWPSIPAYRAYVQWLKDNCLFNLYLDDHTRDYPLHKWDDFSSNTGLGYTEFNQLYRESVDWLTTAFETWGPPSVRYTRVIANTAGWIIPSYDGICIERGRLSRIMTLARFSIQSFNGRPPQHNIDWYGNFNLPPLCASGVNIESL